MKKSEIAFTLSRILTDTIALFLALTVAYYLRMVWFELDLLSLWTIPLFDPPTTLYPFSQFLSFIWKFTFGMILLFAITGRYRFGEDEKVFDEFRHLFWSISIGMALLVVYFFFAQFPFFSRLIFGLSWGLSILFVLSGRVILRLIRQRFWKNNFGQKHLLILGSGRIAQYTLQKFLDNPAYTVIGLLTENPTKHKTKFGMMILGSFVDLESVLTREKPDEICFATEDATKKLTAQYIEIAQRHHVKFRFIPDELGLDMAAVKASTLGKYPIITFVNTKIDGWGYVIKSMFDYICAFIAIIFLSPVFLLISLLIWWTDRKAPIFYRSVRIGRKGVPFACYKFRTMQVDADQQKQNLLEKNERKGGVLFKIKNDPRITPFGKFLRKYSLDELPQLFNVIKGDMSFIGPRPHLPEEVEKYKPEDLQILTIKPGISGFSQINGRSDLSFEAEMQHEIFYMKNWTPWLDAIIFFKSILIVFQGKNR